MQHFIWLIWHNVGEPLWWLFLAAGWVVIVFYWIPFLIARGIRNDKRHD